MTTFFLPLMKVGVAYAVSAGRRWSVLEHMLLAELAREQHSVKQLASLADLPSRMIVEALIALLRANWVEVRADAKGVRFSATPIGRKRIEEKDLPVKTSRDIRWTSLCFDGNTGSWLRSEELKLVYHEDLPEEADLLDGLYQTYNIRDGAIRALLPLDLDETLEPEAPTPRNASRPYARFSVRAGEVDGMPSTAPLRLRELILSEAAKRGSLNVAEYSSGSRASDAGVFRDTFTDNDLIVGGDAHLAAIRAVLVEAKTACVIHSCFVHPETVRRLLPEFEKAARRNVRIELLYGLRHDAEDEGAPPSIADTEAVLDTLPALLRKRVRMSQMSSGAHGKLVLWDTADSGWRSLVGSCNWLSSWYDAIDVSIMSRSPQLAVRLMSWLLETQLPSIGGWSAQARRLNGYLGATRIHASQHDENGDHSIRLLTDEDHFAALRTARDLAKHDIVLGCDLFGNAAETTTVVPMERAAELGRTVHMYYARPTKRLLDAGLAPKAEDYAARNLNLLKVPKLHGKFLAWDDLNFVASSFNWLSTIPDTRVTGAEFGLLVEGAPFRAKLRAACIELGVESDGRQLAL
jgi:DNA-binding MarR family transcriptional regulator